MTITVVSRKPVHGGEGVKLTLRLCDKAGDTSEGTFVLSFDDYTELSPMLGEGGEIGEELFSVLEEKSRYYAAYSRAVYLLSFGDCNRRRLTEKLLQRGIDRESADEAVDALCREGCIDEFSQIREWMLRLCREKHYGRRRILSELYRRGYGREDIQRAFSLFEGELDYDEARAALLRRVFGTETPDTSDEITRRKLYRILYQYGF